ncbi:MAG: glycine--tRNA ligase subunit beta [Pseudomonadales bacterium]
MNTRDLLIEIGTEELPPKALYALGESFHQSVCRSLDEKKLSYKNSRWFASPRRLAILINDLVEKAPDQNLEVLGPPVAIAFDSEGQASKAAIAFARKNGLDVNALETKDTEKGERLVYRHTAAGVSTSSVIADITEQALASLPIPKRMRWGASRVEFVRPAHWIVLLFGEETIPGSILGINSDNRSRGHRFHCTNEIRFNRAADYESVMEQAYVIADFQRRQNLVKTLIEEQAAKLGAQAVIDSELLNEVTALVEWPVALTGNFEHRFLEVPAEALISSMSEHQKYFHVVDKTGQLLPHFIFVANLESSDPAQVIAGNERVIRPRLADAAFFFEMDKKQSLASRCDKLKSVVFQKDLGTVWDKSQRVAHLARTIAATVGSNADEAGRAAELAKADLVSDMVQEFDKMQGIAGSYYALNDGEPGAVVEAIAEQYLPKYAGDDLPHTAAGMIISLADRIDTIVGIFGINQAPTGSKDPFALRRNALAVIRIIAEKSLFQINLNNLLAEACFALGDKVKNPNVVAQVSEFLFDRYRAIYQERGIATDTVIAVQAAVQGSDTHNPADVGLRISAVEDFRQLAQAEALAAANKRVANILAKQGEGIAVAAVDIQLFENDAEKDLFQQLESLDGTVAALVSEQNYTEALKQLACLKEPVDLFFEEVMVMTDDIAVRSNRINLLRRLSAQFMKIADISQLQI